jgi:TATA-box binding protein (TBP) (component of TFIID and TFIIIB)
VLNSVSYIKGRILRIFENRVLRRIFGSKKCEVTGARENCRVRNSVVTKF